MAANSAIEWCTHTASPWYGCQHAGDHPGCINCYAEAMAKRNPKTLGVWGPNGTRVVSKSFAANCRRWNKQAEAAYRDYCDRYPMTHQPDRRQFRQSVFPSICDPFEDWQGRIHDSSGRGPLLINAAGGIWPEGWPSLMPGADDWGCRELTMDDLRRDLFRVIDSCPWLDFLLLTKRPENVACMWLPVGCDEWTRRQNDLAWEHPARRSGMFRPNAFIGTSVSDQPTFDRYAHTLYHECRALTPFLFFSMEPLLGPIKMCHEFDGTVTRNWRGCFDQVIVGVESNGQRVGRLGAFASEAEWNAAAQSIVDQCRAADVAAFVKQIPINGKVSHDPSQWPADLRVRQMPEVARA